MRSLCYLDSCAAKIPKACIRIKQRAFSQKVIWKKLAMKILVIPSILLAWAVTAEAQVSRGVKQETDRSLPVTGLYV